MSTGSVARVAAAGALLCLSMVAGAQSKSELEQLRRMFAQPPGEARMLMRWWWFGGAVEPAELERELRAMQRAAIGGVEIQPVYPLELNDAARGIENRPYLSPAFLDALHFAAGKARELGLRVDITLGSGWPYGGPGTTVTHAAGRLRVDHVYVPEGARSMPRPALENGEELLAAFVAGKRVAFGQDGRVELPPGLSGSDVLEFFISSRTGQQVKRSSVGAEGFVLDHYERAATLDHLQRVGDLLLRAFGDKPPYAVFSDSLEVYGSDWTPDFLNQFQKRRGYDLTPFLPEFADEMGQRTRALRHDWGKTLTELAEEDYLMPIREWAHAHGTLFRSQTYGEPPVILSSNAFVDLPEGEHGPLWRRFSAARWASSASHLYGHAVTSTETWTWLHSPVFRATPLDLKAEADRHFVEGINQIIGHGWPYSPPAAGEPGWRFYAAAALNEHNPWFQVMPELARYLQRVSFLLRQGKPANDVAIYLPTDDAWAHLELGKTAVDEMTDALLGPALIPAVLNAGYNFDFIDDRAIKAVGIPYPVLILPGIERVPLATLEHLQEYVAGGGHVIATRSLPSRAPGLLEEASETPRITALAQAMFRSNAANTRFAEQDADVGHLLPALLPPDFSVDAAAEPALGFIHRKLPYADIYFLANASNRPVETEASLRAVEGGLEQWDPFTGEAAAARCTRSGERTVIRLSLAPYESRVLVFSKEAESGGQPDTAAVTQSINLSSNWTVAFPDHTTEMSQLKSWTADERTRFFSGIARYTRTLDIPAAAIARRARMVLDFGAGVPGEPDLKKAEGMHVLLDSPVRESAVVFINGQRAGGVWHPPYRLEVGRFLRAGMNELRIDVGNLAVNEMAGRPLPDYRLLNMRYGTRFEAQDMSEVKAQPAGLLGPVELRVY